MACKRCGSDWRNKAGKDCPTCPNCCKQQRCRAKKEGLWTDPEQVKQCKECGSDFVAVGLFQIEKQTCCRSPDCQKQRKRRSVATWCAKKKSGQPTNSTHKQDRGGCARCQKPLRFQQAKYCSRLCAGLDTREYRRPCNGKSVSERVALDFANWCMDWERQRPKPAPVKEPTPPCRFCSSPTASESQTFCSLECAAAWRGDRVCRCGSIAKQSSGVGPARCQDCRKQAKLKARRKSRKLRKNNGNYRRSCRKYGGHFNSKCKRADVLARDNYVCHVCKKKCNPKRLSYGDPRAATLDHHPVPLSKGGDHDWHNVRCACMKCNSLKSNSWDGQRRMSFS